MKRKLQFITLAMFIAGAIAWSVSDTGLVVRGSAQSLSPAQNPCAKKQGQNPCNPCAKKKGMNPCAMKKASDEIYTPATAYSSWQKINKKPFLSEAHGGMFVTTYANQTAEAAIKSKSPTLPDGSILVKESHAAQNGKPGMKGTIFSMEKTADGWLWVTTDATGHVMEKGNSAQMQMCAQCHQSAKTDSAFLRAK